MNVSVASERHTERGSHRL